jgi:hypothetical protein
MARKFIRPLWLLLLLNNIPRRQRLNRTKYHMGNLRISSSPSWDSQMLRMVLLVRSLSLSLSLSSHNQECTSNRRCSHGFNKLSRSRKLKFRERFSRSNRKLRFRVKLNPSLKLARMVNTLSPSPSLSLNSSLNRSHMLSHLLNSNIRLSRSLVHTANMTTASNTSSLIPKAMARPSQHNRSRRSKTQDKCNKLSRLNKPSNLRRNRSPKPKPHLKPRLRLDTSRKDRRTCTTRRRLTRIRTCKHGFSITHKEGKISLARLISSPYQV